MKKLKKLVLSDLKRYGYENNFFNAYFKIPGFRFSLYLRITQSLKSNKILYNLCKIMLRQMSYKYGIDIYPTTRIGKGFYIGHFGGIVVNGNTSIGNNVNISQGVTIGRISNGKNQGVPVIGDLVWLGASSVIVGGITIGSGSVIGPGSYVNFDVPENCLVMGNPGKIIKTGYINGMNNNICV
ncbi:serine acetyltransferase [uncultured Nonlabens sp.]|uniref:serine O-acetyltransferase n=1 Tax=uncultured Nonlabens sp. TaxID=859306 RepID=UPI0030DBA2D4|tara:strand:- start:23618 stop:24166 length:549 start_codon:yes stop_codon:yes gene_type:complete